MARKTTELRTLWKAFECKEAKMVLVPFGPDRIRVAPETADAWTALACVLAHHKYEIRTKDTDSYNCREAKGGGRSLHSFGIALDVNWTTNPYLDHAGQRAVRYSDKATQAERAEDVRRGQADTDMTKAMIDDVARIKTKGGVAVFEWGGSWKTVKDCMHFELDVGPDDLAKGIDWATVAGSDALGLAAPEIPVPPAPVAMGAAAEAVSPEPHVVIARDGLKLRAGPGLSFGTVRSYPRGTIVHVLAREGEWALVDLQGDGGADGFMFHAFLRPTGTTTPAAAPITEGIAPPLAPAIADELALFTPALVKTMFPFTPASAIAANLPHVLAGLRAKGLADRSMALMALATIRAETEGFQPISEGRSRFNTRNKPFDLYEPGTSAGQRVGNTQAGDGARFKGRGYVQLTGRFNYTRVGREIGVDLVASPDTANDPPTAGIILAQFLRNVESRLRAALAAGNLKLARKLINGGSHGLDRFVDAYERGQRALRG
ncbi:MAG TPA: M15 family metallopeptidase [Sphingomicrobium sp.]|nr:M15 family metallopeptidase [Sphingomicrobium sp.]